MEGGYVVAMVTCLLRLNSEYRTGNASKFRLNPPFLKKFFRGWAGGGGGKGILTMTINVHVILLA